MNIKRISLGTGKFHIYRSEIVNSTFVEKEVEFSFTIHEEIRINIKKRNYLNTHSVYAVFYV